MELADTQGSKRIQYVAPACASVTTRESPDAFRSTSLVMMLLTSSLNLEALTRQVLVIETAGLFALKC